MLNGPRQKRYEPPPADGRPTDEQIAEVADAIAYLYEAGEYPLSLSPWARLFLGPDNGTLALLQELRAERARNQATTPEDGR